MASRTNPSQDRGAALAIYSQTEIARYSGIPLTTVRRWLSRRQAISADQLASFDDFVSLLFVRELRQRHVPYADIVVAEDDLRERTGDEYPFVHEALWVAGRDVLVKVPGDGAGYLSPSRRGQLTLPNLARPDRIELPRLVSDVRGQVTYEAGRVSVWRPTEGIAARPLIQFGLTCIDGTRLTTRSLSEAIWGGDDSATVARLFGTTETEVARAVAWELELAA